MRLKPRQFRKPRRGHWATKGLGGLWLFNEGSGNKVFDLSGNGIDGILTGDVTWTPGQIGHVLDFPGSVDYVNFGFWNHPFGQGTWIALVKFDEAIGAYEQIANAHGTFGEDQKSLQFRRTNGGKLQLITFTEDVTKAVIGNTTLTTGLWWWVAGVNDGVNNYVYVNGILDGTAASGIMDNDIGVHYLLGGRDINNDLSSITDDFQGQMGYFADYGRGLSASEIAELYWKPFGMFERDSIELWVGATSVGVVEPPTGIAVYTHHYQQQV